MTAQTKRLLLWSLPLALLVVGLGLAFRPQPLPVDLVRAEATPLVLTLRAEGQTRVREVYRLSAPVAGEVERLPVDVGDQVVGGETVVATLRPAFSGFLDARALAEAEAALRAAEAALQQAEAEADRARAELSFARAELVRTRTLARDGTVAPRSLERASLDVRAAEAALNSALAAQETRRHQLEVARARLMQPETGSEARAACCVSLRAPITGQVLTVLHKSQAVIPGGTPLLEIGDPASLEVVADFLSADAVTIAPGMAARLFDWGGEPLDAVVRRVEPAAFTRVSALGIEEQRVNVILDLAPNQALPERLGHGFRVMAEVVVWQADSVLTVPLGALFREGTAWAVFRVENDTARLHPVTVGRMSGERAEILSGLAAGDSVVLHPSDRLEEGMTVVQR